MLDISYSDGCRQVPLRTSLRVNPMPPRITRKSYRPRVSDRTIVDTPYNRQGLRSFQDRVASSSSEKRATKMEKQNQPSCQGHTTTKRLSWSYGLEVKKLFSTSGRGRNISLDIPLYRTGDVTSLRFFRQTKERLKNNSTVGA